MKLGLVMIVRDEQEMLRVTLPAVKPLISAAYIVDTGSKDSTIDVAVDELDGVATKVETRGWLGFADARTFAIDCAHGWAAQNELEIDYWLALDADMLVQLEGELPELSASAYYVRLPGDFQMWLPLVLKNGPAWGYAGGAHAHLVMPPGSTTANLYQLTVVEQRAASPREDTKFTEDLAALEAKFDPRSVFYYAQTLKDLGHEREAADAYRLRIRISSGHPEEVFWACYQEGLLRAKVDGERAAIPIMLEAWARRPTRVEPLYWLAQHHRLAGMATPALLFAQAGAEIEMPADRHFVLSWMYEWGMQQELALCYEAVGWHDEADTEYRELAERASRDDVKAFAMQRLERPKRVAVSAA